MRRALWLLPLLALAGCKDSASQAGVKVTVTYEGFQPRCMRVLARDVGSGGELSKNFVGAEVPDDGSLIVGVLTQEGWGSTVDVVADAFEQSCEEEPVVSSSARVPVTLGKTTETTLALTATDADGDGYVSNRTGGTDCDDTSSAIHPGVTALSCNEVNDLDANCNGQRDSLDLGVGQACTEGERCEGTRRCGENGAVICALSSGIQAWPDGDGDGHGDRNADARFFCNVVPAGFVTSANDDCDDGQRSVYPGAQELCDGRDNDCDGAQDENFLDRGAACTDAATQCGGQLQCNDAQNGLVCRPSQPVPTWYPDEDGDGFGRDSGAVQTCAQPAGSASQGGDCDDGNPFTYPGARELCDAADNNCDNLPEAAGVCPADGPIWASRTAGASDTQWRSVFAVVPGGVGIVGGGGYRGRLAPGSTTFEAVANGCSAGSGWNTLWVDAANNGRGYFGSSGGRLSYQEVTSTNCVEEHNFGRDIRGLVGLRNGTSLDIHGVTATSNRANEGLTFIWDGASNLTYGTTRVAPLHDVHGVSRNALFAVGGLPAGVILPSEPRIYRFNSSTGQWQQETLPSVSGLRRLNGVWVVNEKLAFAVGESSNVLTWDGTAWTKMAFPNNFENLTSVIAFGASSVYVAAHGGRIYRYNGQSWQELHEDTSARFNDISATSPEDIWAVGDNGLIVHWPQWPQRQ